ncbi:MAG: transglutaminase family protein [Ruminococcus sp.]|nr:transglutaminase family protein [Ruminococcus sp.]
MKHKESSNYSGIVICDSITMSVKKKRADLRWFEAVFIAITGFTAVIMSFLRMFDFTYSSSSVIKACVIFSVIHILFTLAGRKALWLAGGSFLLLAGAVYKFRDTITIGFKFTYNVIYRLSMITSIDYYKGLDDDAEKYAVTIFFVFCIWLLALVIYTFTIHKPNPLIVIAFTFPIIEIGLYNGINIPVFWGILTVAYWIAVVAVCNIDLGEYSGGKGGFVRKDNLFFPKRQMRLKVTEKCAVMLMVAVCLVSATAIAVMKITRYERSDELNQKRADIKYAVTTFSFDDLASSISAVTESFGFTFEYENHKLGTASKIKYKNTTDIVAILDKKQEGAVYFKGYAGAVYDNNEWTELSKDAYLDYNGLFKRFKEYNIYPQDFAYIFSEALTEQSDTTVWIEAKRKKNKSYAPYGTKNYSNMEYDLDCTVSSRKKGENDYSYKFIGPDYLIRNDFLGEKNRILVSASDISDAQWQSLIEEYCNDNQLFERQDYFYIDTDISHDAVLSSRMDENGQVVMSALLESEYRDFVYEYYLQVPDDENITEVYEAFADIIEDGSIDTAESRISLLNAVRERIHSMTEYSLAPGKTPSNRDFVNYFLLENHKGYCAHYATSGVLLARMAGIPARYATGYVVVGEDFSDSNKNSDGSYTLNIQDNRSHAWAEVYLDGFGWVPYEFTAGYSEMSINTETTTTENSQLTQTTTTTVSTDSTSATSTRASSSKTTAITTASSVQTNVTSATALLPGYVGNGSGTGFNKVVVKIIEAIVAVMLIIAVVIIRRKLILSIRKKRFTQGAPSTRIVHMYNYAEKLLGTLKLYRQDMHYTAFADFIENSLGQQYFEKGRFRKFMYSALECSFSKTSPDSETLSEGLKFTEMLSRNIYEKSGTLKKLWLKFILVYI